ncbi:hypothetical protein MNBD_NITROSPINAE05-1228 [hydrothermal vent metagenome]|uniref:Lcl C-terminal domain-containing protein n=1 Tax=hydrothermal vent metagenome TaxID=652676 RepID=A0A3B1D9Z9_9ZZZZ
MFRLSDKVLPVLFLLLGWPALSLAGVQDIGPREPYVAPLYIPPPPPVSRLHLKDNGDGTISDPDSGLMWAQKDSHADLGKCLEWRESKEYVENLRTGGHDDWRMPSMPEIAGIYDNTKENIRSMDHDPEFPLALDEKFADGAAYWYWTSDYHKTDLADCCTRILYFASGMGHSAPITKCNKGGVRGVRNAK